MEKLPNRVREWRKRRDLTLQELADRCNTTHATISRLERGPMDLSGKWMKRLAKELKCSPADLLKPEEQEALEVAQALAADLVADMSPDQRKQWLDIGEALRFHQKAS